MKLVEDTSEALKHWELQPKPESVRLIVWESEDFAPLCWSALPKQLEEPDAKCQERIAQAWVALPDIDRFRIDFNNDWLSEFFQELVTALPDDYFLIRVSYSGYSGPWPSSDPNVHIDVEIPSESLSVLFRLGPRFGIKPTEPLTLQRLFSYAHQLR